MYVSVMFAYGVTDGVLFAVAEENALLYVSVMFAYGVTDGFLLAVAAFIVLV